MMTDPNCLGHEFMYRVDVFEYGGMLKLNEIESFDAAVYSKTKNNQRDFFNR